MPRSIAFLPLFKGDREAPRGPEALSLRRRNEQLITGQDAHGGVMEPESYLQVLCEARRDFPELVQDIGRVFASRLYQLAVARQGTGSHLYCTEGLLWDWGAIPRTGAETAASIAGIVPEDLRAKIPPDVIVESSANRTRQEISRALRRMAEHGDTELFACTHGYHQPRAQRIAQSLRQETEGPLVVDVFTPGGIASWRENLPPRVQPSERFLLDVIRATEPRGKVLWKELWKELLLSRPLDRVSRGLRWAARRFGRDFDLEGWLADKMRGKGREADDV